MTEEFSYTYQDLLDKALELCKSEYKNVDAYSSPLNVDNKIIFSSTGEVTCTQAGKMANIATDKNVVDTNTIKLTATVTSGMNKPEIVKSDDISTVIKGNMDELCGYSDISDTVTAKGILAFMNFLDWFLQKNTVVLQPSMDNEEGVACIVLQSTAGYSGLKKESDELIKKEDFESISWVIGEIATKAATLADTTTYALSGTCSSSSCSSSCSSSSSSSSCSSSSSSSCSSSCSSIFIAYMQLV